MSGSDEWNWIEDGQKYALVALNVKTAGAIQEGQVGPGLWVYSRLRLPLSNHWREWIGSMRVEEIEACNLFLVSKITSQTPDILDGENHDLSHNAQLFYAGLLLSSPFAPAHKPATLSGSRRRSEIDIRQKGDFKPPIPRLFASYPALTARHIEDAARYAGKIRQLEHSASGVNW